MSRLIPLLLCGALLLSGRASGMADGGEGPSGPLVVSVSVPPLAYLAERIGGTWIESHVMVPAGAAPATYAPKPSQLERLAHSRAYVAVGHPDFVFEQVHITPFLMAHPKIRVVDMTRLPSRPNDAPIPDHDPHVWLSPRRMAATAAALTVILSEIDPQHGEEYESGLRRFLADIESLDTDIRANLRPDANEEKMRSGARPLRILVLHPAWGWFAADYGVVQIAIEEEGKAPGPRRLIPLIEEERSLGTRVVFVQRGFARKYADLVAAEIGATVREVDPLASDWLDNLRQASMLFGEANAYSGLGEAGQ